MFNRRSVLGFFAALVVAIGVCGVPSARADNAEARASAFIESLAERAISALTEENVAREDRVERFRELLNDNFAVKTIGRWVLGRYWKRASKEQQTEYLQLFEDLIVTTYVDRFEAYSDEQIVVSKAEAGSGSDFLVKTTISRPSGGNPVKVSWRVRARDETFKIVDVVVEGVSMGQTQRSEFASVIRRNGGTVEGLLSKLRVDLKKGA
ncbi:MAG: ABC transporter substrate-binding protein [Rhodospirillales bacterium]|nr:ABC transporter substrate-binding protein [Alphaproteobacteria bacterium]MBL6928895.1 ABC transporter substrate-binding protein [Rhodospirillales bacterium]